MKKRSKHLVKQPKRNLDIRVFVEINGVTYTEIAEVLEVSQSAISQRLRLKMAEKWKEDIIEAVYKIKREKGEPIYEYSRLPHIEEFNTTAVG